MILMYHKIHPNIKSKWWVSPDTFYQQMLDLYSYKVVFLDNYDPLDKSQFVVTFDDAYENILEYAVPILKMLKFPFEVFVIGKCIDNNYMFESAEPFTNFASRGQLLNIVQAGGRLQWHTMSHYRLKTINKYKILDQELIVPDELRRICPEGFKWFAYPYGESNDEYKSKVSKYFSGGLAIDDGNDYDKYNLKRISIFEGTYLTKYFMVDEKAKYLLDDNFMKISVIIPVYNADRFITKAVDSALEQPETAEIILVEDNSPDNSLEVCTYLANKYDNVHLIKHPSKKNMGAGASRNLGIKHAKYEYIAFLDADDFYLPGRFLVAKKVFSLFPDCDGVYEATGRYVENEEGLVRWRDSNRPFIDLYTVNRHTSPDYLGKLLIREPSNCISPDGLVFKKYALKKSGLFNEELKLHQDVDFMTRFAISCKLLPGRLYTPSSKWRLHERNRISSNRSKDKEYKEEGKALLEATYNWCRNKGNDAERKLIFLAMIEKYEDYKQINGFLFKNFPRSIKKSFIIILWIFEYPRSLLEIAFWHYIILQFCKLPKCLYYRLTKSD